MLWMASLYLLTADDSGLGFSTIISSSSGGSLAGTLSVKKVARGGGGLSAERIDEASPAAGVDLDARTEVPRSCCCSWAVEVDNDIPAPDTAALIFSLPPPWWSSSGAAVPAAGGGLSLTVKPAPSRFACSSTALRRFRSSGKQSLESSSRSSSSRISLQRVIQSCFSTFALKSPAGGRPPAALLPVAAPIASSCPRDACGRAAFAFGGTSRFGF
mmetsp:Transcript_27472/g.69288  ORF Transcript_27472/g.69288 Transcript_27472/m.69288 type:complete len:215 (-) Transcript_27472:2746-3390(-)